MFAETTIAEDPPMPQAQRAPRVLIHSTQGARCADGHGTLSSLFFSDDDIELAQAQAVCRRCDLSDSCLAGAIERIEPYGVWGGKLVVDGVPHEAKPKRGRPPKSPRPILVVDELRFPDHLVA